MVYADIPKSSVNFCKYLEDFCLKLLLQNLSKMRLAKHLKIISPQVEHLEDLESQLEILLDYVKNATKEGKSWVNNADNKLTFLQINQLLTNAAAHCIKKCVDIANENDESSPSCQPSFTADTISATADAIFVSSEVSTPDNINDTTTKCLNDRLKKVEEIVSQNSNKIRSSKAKIKDLEKRNDTFASQLDETNKRNDIKSDEIMKEFEDASNFMSDLQLKIEALSDRFEKLQPDISERLKHVEEQLDSISKSGSDLNKDTLMKYVDERFKTVSKSCSVAKAGTDYLAIQLSDEVKSLRKDIDTVNANLASTKGKIHETRIEECKRNLDIKEKVFLIETQVRE
ncbi:hypothetical protein Btru_033864 [Bulinus truncatus]|nr:hypothetical protein Btru_033864 [Bulinus truncatus]